MFYAPQSSINVLQGEIRNVQLDFSDQLDVTEVITTAISGVKVWSGTDLSANVLPLGPTFINGGLLSQLTGAALPLGFQGGTIYSVWFIATTNFGQTLEGFVNVNCVASVPPTYINYNPLLPLFNSLIWSLPSIQAGDSVPASGFPFLNASGYVVMSLPAIFIANAGLRAYLNSLIATVPNMRLSGIMPLPGFPLINSSNFLAVSQPPVTHSDRTLWPFMTTLIQSLPSVPLGDVIPPVGQAYIDVSGYVVLSQ